eukprot:CAMPEP_0174253612 /NCGR_PEP_ID=MMETSP0439-20130205/2981_1 /TAXON_ID=0 /ORGANISM="Stereomyxa ramosa, Strain Chinc5" /LENGTH=73 /DNA_ID=CAMNT_0015334731 /DNA_START=409 /DNA_END=627 /DNA_ORIENTATION=-
MVAVKLVFNLQDEEDAKQGKQNGNWKQLYRHLSAIRVCDRCHQFYRETQNTHNKCHYHPGIWVQLLTGAGDKW